MSKCNQLFMEQQESEEFRRYLAENEPMEYPPDYQADMDRQPPKDYVDKWQTLDKDMESDSPPF